jgi:hypothetical protein
MLPAFTMALQCARRQLYRRSADLDRDHQVSPTWQRYSRQTITATPMGAMSMMVITTLFIAGQTMVFVSSRIGRDAGSLNGAAQGQRGAQNDNAPAAYAHASSSKPCLTSFPGQSVLVLGMSRVRVGCLRDKYRR